MQIRFLGANRQVTGSRYCLTANGTQILIDCGMFQEREFLSRNWEPSPIHPHDIKALFLTHVHIDHSGLIPKLVREGYKQPIYATEPTVALAGVVLPDSAHIQAEDAKYKKKRHKREGRRGKYPELPLYRQEHVKKALKLFRGVKYGEPVAIHDGIEVTFHDAGHILGSAILEVVVEEAGERRRILFSGDIGQENKPLVCDPTRFDQADYVIMESTYGDREHESTGDVAQQLGNIISETAERGGNVVIPTFAIERAQELMYHISQLVYDDKIPDIPIFLDSPMAVDVTETFRDFHEYLDEEAKRRIMSQQPPLRFPGLRMVTAVEDSKAINDVNGPCIIMSTAGMCNAGRIKHHLKHNIGRPECTILFTGYQAQGTLGRQILEGNQNVRIHGLTWKVRARVTKINGLSAHADHDGLQRWLGRLKAAPRQVFLTHGEETASLHLAENIRQQLQWPVTVPKYGDVVSLE